MHSSTIIKFTVYKGARITLYRINGGETYFAKAFPYFVTILGRGHIAESTQYNSASAALKFARKRVLGATRK